jgi:hypothetical protein
LGHIVRLLHRAHVAASLDHAKLRAANLRVHFLVTRQGNDFLLKHKGALPVPVVITEPAVGYGFGLGLLFFSGPIAEAAANSTGDEPNRTPPNVTALGGVYTENGTWAAAATHFHTWDDDRYRYLGAVAKVDALASISRPGLTPGANLPMSPKLRRMLSESQCLMHHHRRSPAS